MWKWNSREMRAWFCGPFLQPITPRDERWSDQIVPALVLHTERERGGRKSKVFAKRKEGLQAAKAAVQGVRKKGNPLVNLDHL
jgi:hypothetical protein